jgi:YafQ family addiction module toxin component
MFDFDLSDGLRLKINKLLKKDKKKVSIINKKIQEVVNCNKEPIERYKNLRYGFKRYKRIHIDRSFVLIFEVKLNENLIIFTDFDHHDRIYKK